MAILHSAFGVILLAATSGSVLASAQSTTTYPTTSTSWALLDNTDLFPKQTTPAAAATAASSSSSTTTPTPTPTTSSDSFQITPPIPCPGLYYTYGGICCAGSSLLDCDYTALHAGTQAPSSCCPPGQFVWALPLAADAIARAAARGDYSGCPGNMRNGVCCSGGVIYRDGDDGAEVCGLGEVVWVETTGVGGVVGTSTVAEVGTTTAAAGSGGVDGWGMATPAGATATVTVTGGGASLGGGWAVADGRVWWGAMALGVLGRW